MDYSSGTIQTPPPITRNSSKKKTDKEGFTYPTKTKKLKLTDHPNVSTENPIPLSNKFDALAPMDTDPPPHPDNYPTTNTYPKNPTNNT
ncbi:hypothetical protein TNCT_456851 [Trichonephila clavata]|uniref:Uncharacterized protein n=1 Tax=Trichonephila clavata TaxID=2740835 RepID=A0A8X6KB82_TRICU|nr:hypothetical protein TNCT_456851 [Trichonephila clavata]